jgi:P4 family phage/plasmid primase-like protien
VSVTTDTSGFLTLLALLRRTDGQIRIATSVDGQFYAPNVVAIENVVKAVDALRDRGAHAWFEVNPSGPRPPGRRAQATDITRLAALWADLDLKEGGLATEEDIDLVIDDLAFMLGRDPAAVVSTGGGKHAYWPIADGDITDANYPAIRARLDRWKLMVQQAAATQGGHVDSVFDLPRILRVPGTLNPKYTPAREVTMVTAEARPLTLAEIDEAFEAYDIPAVVEQDFRFDASSFSPSTTWAWAEQDCHFVSQLRSEISTSVPNARHPWLVKQAILLHCLVRNGCVTERTFMEDLVPLLARRFDWICANVGEPRPVSENELGGALVYGRNQVQKMAPEKLLDELRGHWHDDFVDALVEAPAAPALPVAPPTPAGLVTPPPLAPAATTPAAPSAIADAEAPSNVTSIVTRQQVTGGPAALSVGALALNVDQREQQRYARANLSDLGNGERLAAWMRGKAIYVPGLGWHVWEDGRYVPDLANAAQEHAKDAALAYGAQAIRSEAEQKWAYQSYSAGKISAALALASSVSHVVTPLPQLDTDGREMCTPGGVVDLATGTMRPADPHVDRHTKRTLVTPDAKHPMPRFVALMQWALGGDEEMIAYVQRLFGLAAIGELRSHILPIFKGRGGNGKSLILGIVLELFGSYGVRIPGDLLVEKSMSAHPTGLASLRGARFALGSEVPPGARFDEALVKELTGDQTLTARYMGKDFITFVNTWTPFLSLNHLPGVAVGGPSWWRRIRIVPFDAKITGPEDPDLHRQIIASEGPGILAWVIAGARDVLEHGERPPKPVLDATAEYRQEEDRLAQFVHKKLVIAPGMTVSREAVYGAYCAWCMKMNLRALGGIKFAREMLMAYPDSGDAGESVYAGFALAVPTMDPESAAFQMMNGGI